MATRDKAVASAISETMHRSLPRGKAASPRSYRSPALAAIHESVSDLHEIGLVDDRTMRTFDIGCLTPILELSPSKIRNIRKKEAVSQAAFALHLNVTTGVVSKWERGEKRPSGTAAKLLTLIAKNGLAAIA